MNQVVDKLATITKTDEPNNRYLSLDNVNTYNTTNANSSSLNMHGELSRIIQNFDKMDVKEIDPTTTSNRGIEFREGAPIRLLEYDKESENGKFGQIVLNPEALEILCTINEPLAIISVGKQYF